MNYRKVLAVGSVVGMSLMSSVSAFAATPVAPKATDKASISIKNVEAGATVEAYQIVEGVYNDKGIVRFQQTAGSKAVYDLNAEWLADNSDAKQDDGLENITDEAVTTLSQWLYTQTTTSQVTALKNSGVDKITLTYDASTKTYQTNKAEAGSYLVIVRSSDKTYVYNPMYVSNSYTDANDASTLGKGTANETLGSSANGVVNATEDASDNKMVVISTKGIAYAKKSHTSLDKDIVNSSTGSTEVEDVQVGDTVTFDITNRTPDYSEAFTDIYYRISDTQMEGLDKPAASAIKVYTYTKDDKSDKTALDASNYTITVSGTENKFTVDFDDEWLIKNPLTNILIEYSTTVNDKAKAVPSLTNVNRATLEYSTLPTGEQGHLEDTVQLYTFEAHCFKIDEDGIVTVNNNKEAVVNPLAGATFQLTGVTTPVTNADGTVTNKDISDRVYTMTTGTDGKISFEGLDAGVYRLKETDAPDGMFLIDNIYTVTITPTYDTPSTAANDSGNNELLGSYTIEIKRTDASGNAVAEEDGSQVDVTSTYALDKTALNKYLEDNKAIVNNNGTTKTTVDDFVDPADYYDYYSTWTSTNYDSEVLASGNTTVNALGIVNYHLSKLPSTGGVGTILFTVGGVVMAIGGTATVLGGKRKKEDKEA